MPIEDLYLGGGPGFISQFLASDRAGRKQLIDKMESMTRIGTGLTDIKVQLAQEGRTAELFPSVKTQEEEAATQAGQKTTIGGVASRAAERGETAQLAEDKAFLELLYEKGETPAQFRARTKLTTGEEVIAKAQAGTAEAQTTTRLASAAERAKRSELETNIKLDRVKGKTADALINANIPQIQAETQAAVLALEPARIQSLIDLNVAKSQLATSDAKGIESLRPLAIANDWSNEEFDKWAFLQGKIELVEDDIQRRQDLYKALAQVKLNTGDAFQQILAQSQGTGNALDLLPTNVQKEEAERILTEQIIAQDDLIVRIFPEWAEIANKALLASLQAFGVEPSARDIKREKPLTQGAERTTQAQARRKAEGATTTRKLTQEQIRQKAAEFNQAQGQ